MNLTSQIQVKQLTKEFGKVIINSDKIGILELDRQLIIDSFKEQGVLLFRGFEGGVDSFIEFSNSLSKDFQDYSGGVFKRNKINNNPTVLTVNDFTDGLKLHGEMYYQKNHPAMLWFFCAQPPVKDGQTTLCDGKQFYRELNDSLKNLFDQKKLKYIGKSNKDAWQKRYKTEDIEILKKICADNNLQVEINDDFSINLAYICPAIYPSKCGKEQIFINSLLPAKEATADIVFFDDNSIISKKIVSELNEIAEKITVEIDWQKGDILMVDNERIMHGRRAFYDKERDIYIRLCAPAF